MSRSVMSPASAGPDPLFLLRNNFYLGAYQAAINESNVTGLAEADAIERDCFMYRSYVALGSYQLVLDEISSSSSSALQAVRLLAVYLSQPSSKEECLSTLSQWLSDPVIGKNPILCLMAGTIYANERNYHDALKCTNPPSTLELMAFNVEVYLKMERVDMAEKQLRTMQQVDEDATLTQLANAWVNLGMGGAKVQEAFDIFQELCEKFSWTVLLMNGTAVCHMHMNRYEDAENILLEALNKDAKDAHTVANLVVCGLHRSKPVARYLNQLKTLAPSHALVLRASEAEEALNQVIQGTA